MAGAAGKAQSAIQLGYLYNTVVSFENISGTPVTSLTKTGTPPAGTWSLDVVTNTNGVAEVVICSEDTKHTEFRTRTITAATDYTTVITGLTIRLTAPVVGNKARITIKDALPVGPQVGLLFNDVKTTGQITSTATTVTLTIDWAAISTAYNNYFLCSYGLNRGSAGTSSVVPLINVIQNSVTTVGSCYLSPSSSISPFRMLAFPHPFRFNRTLGNVTIVFILSANTDNPVDCWAYGFLTE